MIEVTAVLDTTPFFSREAFLKRKINGLLREAMAYVKNPDHENLEGYGIGTLWGNLYWLQPVFRNVDQTRKSIPNFVCGVAGLRIEYLGFFKKEKYKERGYARIRYVCIKLP